ncbi:MAG: DEAD/DEAH box helicase [Microthrixaceae bacterium]|nr:DEAD/DEAH box helicase [Microthrixaceae bacterium]
MSTTRSRQTAEGLVPLQGSLLSSGIEVRTDLVEGVGFHPAVAEWFERRFPEGPSEPQRTGWPHLAAERSTLIAAPTGSGKTLAGFLMCINDLYLRHAAGESVGDTRVVYVSPLKALAVDIAQNLERPLDEIAELAAASGLAAPALTIGVRTGDTTQSERAAMVRKPPTFVVTTPESLYLLVTAQRSRAVLAGTETVIVDEIHALARDKRGAHLALTLERLGHICARPPVRVGLSATQKPIDTVASLLIGNRTTDDGAAAVEIADSGHQQHMDLALELPEGELEAVISGAQMDGVLDRIAELVENRRTTLVFVNTRRLAERLAHQLGERLGDDVVAAHHGSLSRERRQRTEARLRAGDLKALVATASLELGIDVGPVELVCQIGSPRSIATFLQRVGRSNHTRVGTPTGRLFPLTRDELVESTALLAAVRAGRLDSVEPPEAPLDILAQQIVAETAAQEWHTDALFDLVRTAHHYRALPRETFDEVVELVSKGVMTGRGPRAAHVHHDAVNGELRGRRGARLAALTSGGAIPELGDFRVVLEPEETFIGTVNEDWATESMAGDIFLLGTHSWQIRQVTAGQVRVVDAGDKPPTIPFWLGEAPARTVELSSEVSRLRDELDGFLAAADPDSAVAWLMGEAGVGPDAATTVVDYLAAGRATLGRLPTQEHLVLERFFDETGGMQLVVHSPWGGRINRSMGYALRKKFCRSFNFELQASANDDAVVISLGPHHSFPLSDVPRFLNEANIRPTLTQAVLDQPIFQSRWRWNLNRALIVPRVKGGRRNPPAIQRMEADDLMAALFPGAAACQENITGPIEVPDHPIVAQTVHDTLTEGLDVDGLTELWRRIADGSVEVHFRDTTEPSVLAHEILTARPYAFLDDGEAIDRRTNALAIPRGLPVDPSELGRLHPEAIEQVRAEIEPAPSTPDELHDLLAALVLTARRGEWAELFGALEARNRVARMPESPGSPERWHTVEATAQVEALLTTGHAAAADEAAVAVVRGHLELHSPVTASELAGLTGLEESTVRIALADLESSGFALQGNYGAADPEEVQWCSRRLLVRMHSYSRRNRRREVEPVSAAQLVRFWVRWQHVAPGSQLTGRSGVERIVAQLQGASVAVGAWEDEVLATRLRDYRPRWLDELTLGGEVTWGRLSLPDAGASRKRGAGPSRATPVTLAFRDDLEWLAEALRGDAAPELPDAGAVAEVVEAIADRGASFAGELAASTSRLPTEIEEALWEAVARGVLTSDGFAAVRALSRDRRRAGRSRPGPSRLRRAGGGPGRAAGRWSLLVPASAPASAGGAAVSAPADAPQHASDPGEQRIAAEDVAEAWADQLLARWGVVFYDIAAHEGAAVRWRDIQWALRRMEDRGQVRGGRFVNGFSGEQFALPEAVDGLKQVRRSEPDGRTVRVNATDPLNVTGVILPGARVPARRTEWVELPL